MKMILLEVLYVFLFLINSGDSAENKNDSSTEKMVVKVGHIGAVNAMPKAEAILEICRKELWKEGILSEDFDIE